MNTLLEFNSTLKNRKRSLNSSLYHLHRSRSMSWDPKDRPFQHKTYPHATNIFNILNPLYLNEIKDFDKIASHDYILVRDGFFPLLDFFHRFSSPGGSKVILLIHEALTFAVPKAWAKNTLSYNIQEKISNPKNSTSPRSLYLCALTCDSDIRYHSFCEKLSLLKQAYGDALNNIELKLVILLRANPFYTPSRETLHESFSLIKATYTHLGLDCKFWTWEGIVPEQDFHQSCYYYMSDEYFSHAYSYIDHFFLSKRCTPFDHRFKVKTKGQIAVEVSPYYNIHINPFKFEENMLWEKINNATTRLGVGGTLIDSEFFPYSWKLAEEYLFKPKH